jgi:hypothetical protein
MTEITMSVRETTLYSVETPDDETYQTFEYEKAARMVLLVQQGVVAAECVDCRAVIPVSLVDELGGFNRCPAATGTYIGHRVDNADYRRYSDQKNKA